MKLLTLYSPSHRSLFERHLLPSVPEGFWLEAHEIPQECVTGIYKSEGFGLSMRRKLALIIQTNAWGEPFAYTDADVRLYGTTPADLLACLGDCDVAFQCDHWLSRTPCMGFMVIRPSDRVVAWATLTMALCEKHNDDQAAAAEALSKCSLAWTLLPPRYWTHGASGETWHIGDRAHPPADLAMHHANWVMGLENKMALLDEVRGRMAPIKESIGRG
jgi:hypothetical protein